jgi:hypothetical protein
MPIPEDKPSNENDDSADHGSTHERSIGLQSFEARLAQLSPRGDRLDRERLIFLAGQASVANEDFGRLPPGVAWHSHAGWPAAFATMSAVAATLLVMLIMRSAGTNDLATSSRDAKFTDRIVTSPQQTISRAVAGTQSILSARDARFGAIEDLFVARSQERAAWPETDDRNTRPLTPSAWQEVTDEMQPLAPPAGSSNLLLYRGMNS